MLDRLILLGGVLLIIGIVSSKFSARLGLPVLVLFLAVGMLAGGADYFSHVPFDVRAARGPLGIQRGVLRRVGFRDSSRMDAAADCVEAWSRMRRNRLHLLYHWNS